MEQSEIRNFYKDCNVFITGGTGFMGKVLIEKLLRDTELKQIYLLVRPKKGRNAYTRIEELFDDVIFDRLKNQQPKFRNKIEVISGDCSLAGLGLSIDDRQKLLINIDLVFHVAATVNFDEYIKLAYSINVNGTREVVMLGKQMKNLKALVHVSTAFSNCYLDEIDEKFYKTVNYQDVENILAKLSDKEAEALTPKLLGKWPNTYTFTKALGESVIKDMGMGLPICVYRPGIVISTYKEPIQGWIDNFYGPTGVVAGAYSGVLRVVLSDLNNATDLVPVDTCVAGLIASAWDVHTRGCTRIPDNIPIYNNVSSPENPIRWNEFLNINVLRGIEYPLTDAVWAVEMTTTNSMLLFQIFKILFHIIPGFLFDVGLVFTGHKPRMLKTYKKIHRLLDVLCHFSVRKWKFTNSNMIELWRKLDKTDRELFPCSMTTVSWLVYFERYMKGVRLYLFKDPMSTLEKARHKNNRFMKLNTILKMVFVFWLCNAISSLLSSIVLYLPSLLA